MSDETRQDTSTELEDPTVKWVRNQFGLPRFIRRKVKCSQCKSDTICDFKILEQIGIEVRMQRYCWHCRNRMNELQ